MFPITLSVIVLTCLISASAFNNARITDELIFWPPAIHQRRQYYRFLTCGLIHADLMHLAFNMLTLYFFGKVMEPWYQGELGLPHFYYLILYAGAVIVANIPTYLKRRDDYNYRSLGASGGVCAVLFAFVLMRPWQTITVLVIPVPAIIYALLFLGYSVYMSRRGGDNINHDAHFWGALFGVVFTIAVHPSVTSIFMNELTHPRFDF
ncbi:MAG: rhomboid family intramembrane serine protease [Bacteroidota bacterium]|nr:rhomboid family intramembrane serine protease [Bacteroidota bacterium]MDP4217746.1 rhomboid family intramembrane serine protease [Bacteroidota bacterium]MDP4246033.1 rhomboid family intramembrane serine protease [Bacteroidota bacterium]MDP4253321.1 rhomboid family intramembrane serine protease [Bacteroidota bacterium]MDP4257353.1 rhomboid family intramembrane serine protease [Bacteroidota bacterium]